MDSLGSTAFLLWGVLFSSIGFGFFLYGKKQKNTPAFACGLMLMVYPYFISNTYILVFLGVLITAVPYFWKE